MPSNWLPSALLICALLFGTAHGQNDTSQTNGTDNSSTPASLAPSDCHCGFLDPLNGRAYTDSIIAYFNETGGVTDAFDISSFHNRYEKGWSVFYRQGAAESNVYFTNGSQWNISPGWLNLNVSAYTPEHLVNGAQIETKRQDMLFGSFRMLAQPPEPYSGGGTAFGMRLVHNESNSAELDLLNMDDSGTAGRYATTTNGMDPDPNNCVNFTYIVRPDSPGTVFWNFNEYRMDWNDQSIDWYIDTNMTRTLPSTNWTLPMSLSFKHWSNGAANWMQGPPTNNTGGQIGWMRAFFNSSLATAAGQPEGCIADMYCSTEDESIRVTTPYPEEATVLSEELIPRKENKASTAAIALAIASVVLTTALFVFGLSRKAIVRKDPAARPQMMKAHQSDVELTQLGTPTTFNSDASRTLLNARGFTPLRPGDKHRSVSSQRPLLGQHDSYAASSTHVGAYPTPSPYDMRDPFANPSSAASQSSGSRNADISSKATPAGYSDIGTASRYGLGDQREVGVQVAGHENVATQDLAGLAGAVPGGHEAVKAAAPAAAPGAKPPVVVRTRVDYLAGLVAMCSLLVSATHFSLTYVPSVIMEYLPKHYNSEYWARRTIEPFFFNEIWVGIFFTTSTRFLTTGYLRKGELKIIAEKVVCRTPRLMIPIAVVILFEYFLMDVGATKYLEYIPSITWSTWPSTTVYNNFGWFINETLQLVYLIPNAAPQLTYNFCTGVLWTIPVQLQNTWTVLLGAVIVKEIKTPWKRWGYYAFCIINHWYAMSWGSYFWFGLLLADLDINFKYRAKIQSRATLLYPLISIASLLVFLSLGNDLLSVWTGWTFSTNERSIHPEIMTGLNIGATAEAGYPEYTEPKLNGLVFCVAAQFIVEISVWTQKFLSTKPFLLLFPHVFTMYLIHGLVQWSIGSLVCVYFAGIGLAYWLNILLTALISYACLFAALPIVTPVMEMLGKEMTKSIWIAASEEPPAWKPTSWPFEKEEVRPHALEQHRADQNDPRA